jgi:hypothetical protein
MSTKMRTSESDINVGASLFFCLEVVASPLLPSGTTVLLLHTKTLVVEGKAVKLFSFDGGTWFSKPVDYREFRKRIVRGKVMCQEALSTASGLVAEIPDPETDYQP